MFRSVEFGKKPLFCYPFSADGKEEVAKRDSRIWGVQVAILNKEGKLFLHKDPDGSKLEAQSGPWGVIYPNPRARRFNSVSGGGGSEHPLEIAKREMEEELRTHFSGDGKFHFRSDLPVFACYQEKNKKGRLLGGLLVSYTVSPSEEISLQEIGRFWDLALVRRQISSGVRRELFRPAFQVMVEVLYREQNGSKQAAVEDYLQAYNKRIISSVKTRAEKQGVSVDFGVFA
jgi:hypothetical protein